jgi:hypothetical protein
MVIGPEVGIGMKKEVNDCSGFREWGRKPRRSCRVVDRHDFFGRPAALSFQILTSQCSGDDSVEAGKV